MSFTYAELKSLIDTWIAADKIGSQLLNFGMEYLFTIYFSVAISPSVTVDLFISAGFPG